MIEVPLPNTILVTGGAGYIGSHTVRCLAEAGENVVVVDNLIHGHRDAIISPNVVFVDGDIGDTEILDQIFRTHQIEAVIHFAAFAYVGESVTSPIKYYQNNVGASLSLLRVMKNYECRNFIFSSSCATYGDPGKEFIGEESSQEPINPYGRSKLMLEQVLRDCETAFGLKHVNLRYFNASGCSSDGLIGEDHTPETHLIPRLLMSATGEQDIFTIFGTDYNTPDGSCIRDFVHVEDLAAAHSQALQYLRRNRSSTSCNIGTGHGVSVKEIVAIAEEIVGKPIPVKYGDRRIGDPPALVAAVGKAEQVLGWSAQYSNISHSIETAWRWLTGPNKGRYDQ